MNERNDSETQRPDDRLVPAAVGGGAAPGEAHDLRAQSASASAPRWPGAGASMLPWVVAASATLAALVLGGLWWSTSQRLEDVEAQLASAQQQLGQALNQLATGRSVTDHARQQLDILSAPDVARVDLSGQAVAPAAGGRVYWSRARGMTFSAINLPPLSTGQVYQLWVLTSGGPTSATLVDPDAAGRFDAILLGATSIEPTGVALTAEPAGGSQEPTGPTILLGSR